MCQSTRCVKRKMSKDKDHKDDKAAVVPLAREYASVGYREDEEKLDAPNKAYLNRVWDFVIADDYYVPSNNNHTISERPDEVDWDELAEDTADPYNGTSKYRYRYYFDTRLMGLFNSCAEIRLEKARGDFKQVIKIGNGATEDSPMLGRAEHPARVPKFKPSFTAINKNEECRIRTIEFLNAAIKDQGPLKPLVGIRLNVAKRNITRTVTGGQQSKSVWISEQQSMLRDLSGKSAKSK